MCLLSYYPPDVHPDLDALRQGACYSPHGFGYAIVAGDTMLTGRHLNAEAAIAEFARSRSQHLDGPALFHCRYATHGATNLANCHPFTVGGDPRTVIAHNGILPAIVKPRPGDPRSDTRIAAEEFIPTLGPLQLRRTRLALQRWMTRDNKMVILTVDRRFRDRGYILGAEQGIWDGGIWYSNDTYQPDLRPTVIGTSRDWTSAFIICPQCDKPIDPIDGECPWCGFCLDCYAPLRDCQCYPPAWLAHRAS